MSYQPLKAFENMFELDFILCRRFYFFHFICSVGKLSFAVYHDICWIEFHPAESAGLFRVENEMENSVKNAISDGL